MSSIPNETAFAAHWGTAADAISREAVARKLCDRCARPEDYAPARHTDEGWLHKRFDDDAWILSCNAAAIRSLPSISIPTEKDGWVAFGRIKTDIESETETFERIHPEQVSNESTPTESAVEAAAKAIVMRFDSLNWFPDSNAVALVKRIITSHLQPAAIGDTDAE